MTKTDFNQMERAMMVVAWALLGLCAIGAATMLPQRPSTLIVHMATDFVAAQDATARD